MSTTITTDYGKLPREVALRVNAVCDRFEAAWRQGRPARVEEFLADTPEPIYTPLLRELVLLEMDYRRLSGEDSRPEEYRARFPTLPRDWLEGQCPIAALAAAGRYQFLEEIGRGGMGLVLRAHDAHCHRDVAVKVLHDRHTGDAPAEHRFLEGAKLTSQLQHPGVPPVHEIGRLVDGRPFFAMKLVEGRTLAELLRERTGPPEDLPPWLGIFTRICQAVAYAHSHGVIHRDLKPGNIMVGAFGEVQVMDWGLAKVIDATRPGELAAGEPPTVDSPGTAQATLPQFASQAGAIMGTPAYMPPEQARGEVQSLDPRSDVFGLGAILCEILTGHPPYQEKRESNVLDQAASADLLGTFTRLEASGADPELVQLARACLAADQQQRPKDAAVVAEAVVAHQAGVERRLRQAELDQAANEVRAWEARKRRRLRQALAAAVLLLAGLLGMGSLWYAWQRDQAHREATALLELAGDLQDHFRWAEARKALTQASSRLQSVGAEALLDRIRQASADLEAAARLDTIRLTRWTIADGKLASAPAAKEYAAVFQEAGLTIAADNLSAVTERIKQSGIRKAWVAALDDWALATEDKSLRQHLLQLARDADPDRDEWRDRLREPATWEDRAKLEQLAATASADQQVSPHLLTVLAQRLHATGGDAVPLLRSAQRRHPKDFWLNFMLGSLLARREGAETAADAVGYLRAALIVRSDSSVVCNNLAVALEAWGRLDEAIATYRDALRHDPSYALAHNNLGVALAKKHQVKGGEPLDLDK
ncbi:MAG TPA: protein kinase, partial [Gemmataceae bacterium]|nr:protein kinase [Gemmataceae bacterium]